jgi:hypothetical protein
VRTVAMDPACELMSAGDRELMAAVETAHHVVAVKPTDVGSAEIMAAVKPAAKQKTTAAVTDTSAGGLPICLLFDRLVDLSCADFDPEPPTGFTPGPPSRRRRKSGWNYGSAACWLAHMLERPYRKVARRLHTSCATAQIDEEPG